WAASCLFPMGSGWLMPCRKQGSSSCSPACCLLSWSFFCSRSDSVNTSHSPASSSSAGPAPDLRLLRMAGGALRYDGALVAEPGEWLFDAGDERLYAKPVGAGGRQAAWFVQGDFGRAVLRRYRRGGLVARLIADRYLW